MFDIPIIVELFLVIVIIGKGNRCVFIHVALTRPRAVSSPTAITEMIPSSKGFHYEPLTIEVESEIRGLQVPRSCDQSPCDCCLLGPSTSGGERHYSWTDQTSLPVQSYEWRPLSTKIASE